MILAVRPGRFDYNLRKRSLFLITILLAFLPSCFKTSDKPFEIAGFALGTTYSIKFTNIPAGQSQESIHSDVKNLLKEVEDSMSVFNPESEISHFNQFRKTEWVKISKDLFQVVSQAMEISKQTGGAFDITLGNVIDLWGFGKSEPPQTVPASGEILSALATTGYTSLEINQQDSSLRKLKPDLSLNLSAIAKGFAVDRVAQYFEQNQINDYLVEIGGEIRTHGEKQKGKPWVVAIERPELDKRSIFKIVNLGSAGMATSGDYRNFYEIEGKRYSHTIDPESGRPSSNNIASVTVLKPSCMVADALATALVVMGYENGYRFAKEEGIAVLWILRTDNGLVEKTTPDFKTFFSF